MTLINWRGHLFIQMTTPNQSNLAMFALAVLLLPLLFATESSRFFANGLRVDPNRIAARLRIERKWGIEATEKVANTFALNGRRRRQLIGGSPKEETIQVTAPLFSSRLFEYGPKVGDKELSGGIDMAKRMHLSRPITFFGHSHSTIWILSNGGIAFDHGVKQYRPNMFPSMEQKLIAPFWNRNDLRNGGKVLYREINGGRVLERGQSEIRYQYDREVKVQSAVVVTYEKMQPVGSTPLPDENTNSFQLVLFITSNGTFANFIYSNIGWTQGAEAGFNAGDGSNHFALPTSGTGNIMYLEEYGNTGIPGEWMFILEEERVVRCKAGIKGDTCDEACSRGEWGEDCAKCCRCADESCHEVSGECKLGGCARCWYGQNCQLRDATCDAPRKCGQNAQQKVTDSGALSTRRCEEPPPQSQCECLPGYEGNAEEGCADIDECAQKSRCHEKALCTNTPGRFFCQCPEGYSGNGITECVLSFLYPFEQSHRLPTDRNGRIEWQLKHPLKVFGREKDSVVITTNGLILVHGVQQLDTIASGEQPRLDELNLHGVAPFFAPIDLAQQGQIFVEETTDPSLLAKASRLINEQLTDPRQSPFVGSHALMVTYVNVTLADTEPKFSNTFQTLLIGGRDKQKRENMTFVQFLYRDIAWSEGAEAGIMAPDKPSSILLPGSGTVGIEQLSQLSNVRSQGIWLYRIDVPSIAPCIQPDLQPPYCDARSPTLVNRLTPFHPTIPIVPPTTAPKTVETPRKAVDTAKMEKATTTTEEQSIESSSGNENEDEENEQGINNGGNKNEWEKGKSGEKGGQKEGRAQIGQQTEWKPVKEKEAKKEADERPTPTKGETRGKERKAEGKEREDEEGAGGKEREDEEGAGGKEREDEEGAGGKEKGNGDGAQKKVPTPPQNKKAESTAGQARNLEPTISSSRRPAIVTIHSKEIEEMPPDAFDDGTIRPATIIPEANRVPELAKEIIGRIVPELIVPELVVGGKRKEIEEEIGRKTLSSSSSSSSSFLQENSNDNKNNEEMTVKPKSELRIEPITKTARTNGPKAQQTTDTPAEEEEEEVADEQQKSRESIITIAPAPPQRQRPTSAEAKTTTAQSTTATTTTELTTVPTETRTTTTEAEPPKTTTMITAEQSTSAEVSRPFVLITNSTKKPNVVQSATNKRTKATTVTPKMKPNNPDGDEPMLMEFDNTNNNLLAENVAHGNKLSVVVPVAIVFIWLLVLIVVAVFLCCRRRQAQERLRTLYGPAYQIRPVYTMRVNKLGSGDGGSYEEHLDKVAHRLSAEMAYNQNPFVSGRYSLCGSYWNISPQGSAVNRNNCAKLSLNGGGAGPSQSQNASRTQMAPLEISSPRSSTGDSGGGPSAFSNYIQSLAKSRATSTGVGAAEREDAQSEYFANSQKNATTRFSNNNNSGGGGRS